MSASVILNMSSDTVSKLKAGGYRLYAFRGVRTGKARPVLWYATQAYSANTQVKPADGYYAYTSFTLLKPGQQTFMGFYTRIEAGQCLQVDNGGGIGQAVEGQQGLISISSTGDTSFTAGLAQGTLSGTDVVPFYAEPLYGHQTNFAQPTSKVLLVLSTQVLAPGTVIDKLPLVTTTMATARTNVGIPMMASQTNKGILIDAASERTVEYEINTSWKWKGVWASLVSVDAGLTGALIEELS